MFSNAPNSPHFLHEPTVDGDIRGARGGVSAPEQLYSPEQIVVVPLAGAFNFEVCDFSTAALHWGKISDAFKNRLGVTVAKPVIPTKLGIWDINDAYKHFNEDVDHTLEQYDSASRFIYIDHSLGGLLGSRRYAEQRDKGRSAGIINVCSPLIEMRHTVLDPFHLRTKVLGAFAMATLEQMEDAELDGSITDFGSAGDLMVPAVYALPEIEGSTRNLFSVWSKHTLGLRNVNEITGWPIGHIGAITNERAISNIIAAADEMLNIDALSLHPSLGRAALTS